MKTIIANSEDEAKLGTLLTELTGSQRSEADWLNLLSLLEYVGCRKIVKNVRFARVDLQVLRHIAEEASHSFLLKNAAEKLAGAPIDWNHAPLSAVGWEYFRELDTQISALRGNDADDCYPAVSWAIEQRVLWVYPRYLKTTQIPGVRRSLTRILAQEQRHGEQFDQVEFTDQERTSYLTVEKKLWDQFLESSLNYFQGRRSEHAQSVSLA